MGLKQFKYVAIACVSDNVGLAHADFVKLFIKYGADALSKNKAMRTPLDFAKRNR